jgi:hypothetical protein
MACRWVSGGKRLNWSVSRPVASFCVSGVELSGSAGREFYNKTVLYLEYYIREIFLQLLCFVSLPRWSW